MQSFLNLERRNFNSMLRQCATSFLEAKKNNKAVCGCGNDSNFRITIEKKSLICKNCGTEIKLEYPSNVPEKVENFI